MSQSCTPTHRQMASENQPNLLEYAFPIKSYPGTLILRGLNYRMALGLGHSAAKRRNLGNPAPILLFFNLHFHAHRVLVIAARASCPYAERPN